MTDEQERPSPAPDAQDASAETAAMELDASALEAASGGLTIPPIVGKPSPLPGPFIPGPCFPEPPLNL